VTWWRTLHQPPSVLKPDFLHPTIHGSMAWTLLLGFLSLTVGYAWLLIHRYRIEQMEEQVEERGLETAIAERRAEAELVAPR